MTVKREYKIEIYADARMVWYALWDDVHYRKWTSAFNEGSYAKTDDWKEGSTVHFLNPEGNGMFSIITENKSFQKMTFTHKGEIKNFIEQPVNEKSAEWVNGIESYTLTEQNGMTNLLVEANLPEDFVEFTDQTFPVALRILKESAENFCIIVQTTVNAPADVVWEKWNNPDNVIGWNFASDDWHCPKATNDLRIGGKFSYRMEAKDGSMGFDFEGEYRTIATNQLIEYVMADNRHVKIHFEGEGSSTAITIAFGPETLNSYDLQRDGWQSILNNFKKYVEENM